MLLTIGIGGQARFGKDSLSDHLVARLNELCKETWHRNAFANKVKETFEKSFKKDRAFVEKWKVIDEPPPGFLKSIRQCLISIGDGFRQMRPDVWIDLAFAEQKTHQIISDCRYVSEAVHIKSQGGINILLYRPGFMNNIDNPSEQELVPYIKRCLNIQSHEGSTCKPFEGEISKEMDIPYDLFIRNEGDLDALHKKVEDIIIPFLKRKWIGMFK